MTYGPHRLAMASRLLGVNVGSVDDIAALGVDRRRARMIAYADVYGMGAEKLARLMAEAAP